MYCCACQRLLLSSLYALCSLCVSIAVDVRLAEPMQAPLDNLRYNHHRCNEPDLYMIALQCDVFMYRIKLLTESMVGDQARQ